MNLTTNPTCLSLRYNAACCIPLCVICVICGRIHARVLNLSAQKKPQYISRRSRRFTQTKPQNHKTALTSPPHQPVFLCVIMQPAAFLCVICAICGRIYIQTYSIYIHKRNPNVSRWFRRFTQTNHKTTLTTKQHQPHAPYLSTIQRLTRTGIH